MRDGALRLLHVAEHHRIDEAADIKKDVAEPVEPDERAHAVVVVAGEDRHVAGARLLAAPSRGTG